MILYLSIIKSYTVSGKTSYVLDQHPIKLKTKVIEIIISIWMSATIAQRTWPDFFVRCRSEKSIRVNIRFFIRLFLSQTKNRTYLTIFCWVSFGTHHPIVYRSYCAVTKHARSHWQIMSLRFLLAYSWRKWSEFSLQTSLIKGPIYLLDQKLVHTINTVNRALCAGHKETTLCNVNFLMLCVEGWGRLI